jgi:hypothetical protein
MTRDELIERLRERRFDLDAAFALWDEQNNYENGTAIETEILRIHRLLARERPGSALVSRVTDIVHAAGNAARGRRLIAEVDAFVEDLEQELDESTSTAHVGVHGELLDLARRCLTDEGQPIASAMVAGAVLANHLRALCALHKLVVKPGRGMIHPGLEQYRIALHSTGKLERVENREIEVWQQLRNDAAHHRPVDAGAVGRMVDGIEGFMENNPA